jgi:hypothetical protein
LGVTTNNHYTNTNSRKAGGEIPRMAVHEFEPRPYAKLEEKEEK